LAILSLSLGIIFSALTTKYRDLNFLLAFGVQLLMYATPVIYPLSFTKGIFRTILWFNPLTPIIENFRYAFFSTGEFKAVGILYSFATAMALWFLGTFVFNRVERNFMDTV
jgi:lipopolysaccharide transport system permease protein